MANAGATVSPTRRRVRRLAILAVLVVALTALTAWRNRMIAANERSLDHREPNRPGFK